MKSDSRSSISDSELASNLAQGRNKPAQYDRRKAKRQLVDDQEPRGADDGLGQRKHLLLSARQASSVAIAQLAQLAEQRVHAIKCPSPLAARYSPSRAEVIFSCHLVATMPNRSADASGTVTSGRPCPLMRALHRPSRTHRRRR